MIEWITTSGQATFGVVWPLVYGIVKIVCVVLPLILCVAYLTLWERKVIGWMHLRLGPNRVPAPADIEGARVNFVRLMPSTAERVVTFWQTRQSA